MAPSTAHYKTRLASRRSPPKHPPSSTCTSTQKALEPERRSAPCSAPDHFGAFSQSAPYKFQGNPLFRSPPSLLISLARVEESERKKKSVKAEKKNLSAVGKQHVVLLFTFCVDSTSLGLSPPPPKANSRPPPLSSSVAQAGRLWVSLPPPTCERKDASVAFSLPHPQSVF